MEEAAAARVWKEIEEARAEAQQKVNLAVVEVQTVEDVRKLAGHLESNMRLAFVVTDTDATDEDIDALRNDEGIVNVARVKGGDFNGAIRKAVPVELRDKPIAILFYTNREEGLVFDSDLDVTPKPLTIDGLREMLRLINVTEETYQGFTPLLNALIQTSIRA